MSPSQPLGPSSLRRAVLALAAAVGLGAATGGCFVVTDGGVAPEPPAAVPAEQSVDTDAVLSVAAGEGAGLFVEYATGGTWDVFTSCDTNITGRSCTFDVILSAIGGGALSDPQSHDLEAPDSLTPGDTIHLVTTTATKLDGVTFKSDPGATLRVDMLLDGEAQPAYLDWVSGGVNQQGAPTNPVDFVPTAP